MFITFEGIEGSGKTTHSKWAAAYLEEKGLKVIHTREPGGTKVGEIVRKILLEKSTPLAPFAEIFLFAADRAEHVAEVIQPALERGEVVICDRYIDSTTAYQSGGRNIPKEWVGTLNNLSSQGVLPDLTFLLDCPADVGLTRARVKGGAPDRFESETGAFYQRVRSRYLQIARSESGRMRIINSSGSPEVARIQIAAILDEFALRKRK